jgi:hypothetical protein
MGVLLRIHSESFRLSMTKEQIESSVADEGSRGREALGLKTVATHLNCRQVHAVTSQGEVESVKPMVSQWLLKGALGRGDRGLPLPQ